MPFKMADKVQILWEDQKVGNVKAKIFPIFFDFLWISKLFAPVSSGVFLWRQILKCQLLHQMFVRKLLFLVGCFFSVIWNISQINVFETKGQSKCQNESFGKLFLKSRNTSVYFFMFSLLRSTWQTFDVIIDDPYLTL